MKNLYTARVTNPRQQGFVHVSLVLGTDKLPTFAHEIGHNSGLQHTFEEGENNSKICVVGNLRQLPQYETQNIMDYVRGEDRRKYFFLYQIKHLLIQP